MYRKVFKGREGGRSGYHETRARTIRSSSPTQPSSKLFKPAIDEDRRISRLSSRGSSRERKQDERREETDLFPLLGEPTRRLHVLLPSSSQMSSVDLHSHVANGRSHELVLDPISLLDLLLLGLGEVKKKKEAKVSLASFDRRGRATRVGLTFRRAISSLRAVI